MSNNDSPSKQQQDTVRLLAEARRGSLAMAEHALGDLFGRRASGFSDLDGLAFRRGSLESNSAVLDAAIMDLHRRRLSMAMGSHPFMDGYSLGMDNLASLSNSAAAGSHAMPSFPSASVNTEALQGLDDGNNIYKNGGKELSSQSIQEQQQELERRQKELQQQQDQLVAAMNERRKSMQEMKEKLGQMGSSSGLSNFPSSVVSMNRNSLLGSFGGGLAGAGGGLAGAGGCGLPSLIGLSGPATHNPHVSMSFNNQDELMQHDSLSMAAATRASLGLGGIGRRSSLDLLVGTLDRPDFATRFSNQPVASLGRRDSLGFSFSDLMDNPRLMMQQQGLQNAASLLNLSQHQAQFQQIQQSVPLLSSATATGPFEMMPHPLPLAMEADDDWLTPLHCFVRQHCVHVFTAGVEDVATPSKGKRKPITVGQVGIRCPHCHHDIQSSVKARERGSVYFPTSLSSIYNATMNLLQRHLHSCTSVPPEIMRRYETLKADDARCGTSKQYWIESALSLGLVDTENGIRYSTVSRPPLPSRNSTNAKKPPVQRSSNNIRGPISAKTTFPAYSESITPFEVANDGNGPLVRPEDEAYATPFSYHLLCQMLPCVFTEADRLGKRKGLPPGFPGLACRHCFGGFGSGRFFPSSIKTLSDTSKTLNVLHNHMIRCRRCPPEIREILESTRKGHDEQRANMKFGSQKAFFARIWDRLHYKDPNVTPKRKFKGNGDSELSPKKPKANKMSDDETTAAAAIAEIDTLGDIQHFAAAVASQASMSSV